MSEIPEWIEKGLYVRSEEKERMYYELDDIATSDESDERFVVLNLLDNRTVKHTMYDWEFKRNDLIKVKAAACPLCEKRGEIKYSNLNWCMNDDCDVKQYHGSPVDQYNMSEECPRCSETIEKIKDVSDWDQFEYDGRIGRCPNCRVYHQLDSSEEGDKE